MINFIILINLLLILSRESNGSLIYRNMKPWKNGEVFYRMSIPDSDTVYNIQRIMQDIESLVCVKFIESTDRPFIEIGNYVGGCWAHIGQAPKNGQLWMSLPKGCRNDGTIKHEIAHSLGMAHEQQRYDRDDYIKVRPYDILQGFLEASYYKYPESETDYYNTTFDFESISLYGQQGALSKNGILAYEKRDPNDTMYILPSFYKDFSFWDIRSFNKLYKCEDKCKNKDNITCEYPNFINERCECVSRESYADLRCVDNPTRGTDCSKIGTQCTSNYLVNNECRKTCGACYRYKNHGDAMRPDSCEDKSKDCAKKVARGECDYSVNTMAYCSHSCRLPCKKPKYPPPHLICQDTEDPYYCRYIKKNNYCHETKDCEFTCGKCSGGKKQIPDLPCRNYLDDLRCDQSKYAGKCWGGKVRKLCKGSCGLCGKDYPRTFKEVCKDKNTNVCLRKIKQDSYFCHTTSRVQCPRSCRLCDTDKPLPTLAPPKVEKDCKDLQYKGYCDWVFDNFFCGKPEYRPKCRKTCGFCVPAPTTIGTTTTTTTTTTLPPTTTKRPEPKVEANCVNTKYKEYCDWVDRNQWCDLDQYRFECRRKCRDCLPMPTTKFVPKVEADCYDIKYPSWCRSVYYENQCEDSYYYSYCRRTCKRCIPMSTTSTTTTTTTRKPTTTRAPPKPEANCVDDKYYEWCQWVKNTIQDCDNSFYGNQCRKTCRYCLPIPTTTRKTTVRVSKDCKNKHPYYLCKWVIDTNQCHFKTGDALQCAKSCGYCKTK